MKNTILPKGFLSCAKNLGIKDETLDFTVIYSEKVADAAAMFTQNQFCGAPVTVGKENIQDGNLQAFVVNSKNANVANGQQGIDDVHTIINAVAKDLAIEAKDILPSSTGIIGVPLPTEKIVAGIPGIKALLAHDGLEKSAEAIMTTDTFPKFRTEKIGDITICAIAKGSGMIEPNMATMLSYIMTDAAIPSDVLHKILQKAVDVSYNMVSVDGDTSTSDTVAIMANGLAGDVDLETFETVLTNMLISLAQDLARDGEGATTLMEATVTGAKNDTDAKHLAKLIINSPLVKTAVFGADPNWGRIISTIGNVNFAINPEKVSIAFGELIIFKQGKPTNLNLKDVEAYLQNDKVTIAIDLGVGDKKATAWGCDLTYDYVKINGEYST